ALIAGIAGLVATAADDDPATLLQKTKITLSQAVQKATEIAKGGTLASIDLEDDDGKVVFVVEFSVEKKVVEISIDALTGELHKKVTEDEDKSQLVKACKVTIPAAVQTALQKVPGAAYAVELEKLEGDRIEIEVKIVHEGKFHKVEIDAATGEILKVKTKKSESGRKTEESEGGKK
ncbi:MAG: PepSY domain-containing protein, partial [Planctomycetes bacterium]|nr:PepSY domain-containing protein [Planctomycetota bacterium]